MEYNVIQSSKEVNSVCIKGTTIVASVRQLEIVKKYFAELDKHMRDLKEVKVDQKFEISDFAALLFVHPKHLSNTIYKIFGKSPCDFYKEELTNVAKELLLKTNKSVNQIAKDLTFDPSSFNRFFQRHTGTTPLIFRERNLKKELPTI